MKNRIATEYTVAATFAASIMLLALKIVGFPDVFTVVNCGSWGWWSEAVLATFAATGTYLLLFKLLIVSYRNWLWPHVNASIYIGGDWQYSFTQYGLKRLSEHSEAQSETSPTWTIESEGQGSARLIHTIDGITIHAETTTSTGMGAEPAVETSVLASWKSVTVDIWDERVNIAGQLTSIEGTTSIFTQLQIVRSFEQTNRVFARKPREMKGFYFISGATNLCPRFGIVEYWRRDGGRPERPEKVQRGPVSESG